MTTLNITKKMTGKKDLVILEKNDLDRLYKERKELLSAFKAVVSCEISLRQKKTRSFKDFLKSKFPEYVKSK